MPDGGLIVRDEFIPDEDFHLFFSAMDVVWTGYPRHIGLAGILLYASDAGVPVLSARFGSVGWMTEHYGLGWTSPANDADMQRALDRMADGEMPTVDPAGAAELRSTYSVESFEAELTRRLPALV